MERPIDLDEGFMSQVGDVNKSLAQSACHEAAEIAWRSFVDDLDELERPKPRLFER